MKASPVERIKTSRKGTKYKTEDTFFLTFLSRPQYRKCDPNDTEKITSPKEESWTSYHIL